MDSWVSQMLLALFTICAGVVAFLQTRKWRYAGQSSAKAERPGGTGTVLNGYAAMLQRALDNAERWRDQAHRYEVHATELELHVAELERQLDECRRAQRARRAASTTRKRTPTPTTKHD